MQTISQIQRGESLNHISTMSSLGEPAISAASAASMNAAPQSVSHSNLSEVNHVRDLATDISLSDLLNRIIRLVISYLFLSVIIGKLFYNTDYSDVTLVVDGVEFRAHKVILAARSEYFR